MSNFKCPKCPGMMRTYTRANVQIEQCDNCRGIFLDYGELEAVERAEAQWQQAAPAAPPPAQQGYAQPQQGYQQPAGYQPAPQWQHQGHQQPHYQHGHHRQRGFGSLFFST
ncbi:zf-TFIIB domain-containing protein [Nocardioides litoris]|uniref:TFIIB-type zinc ribbon-containing protein n=1 Tax=Nocardioides litoris TaxID=1926648 RepID=UPI001FE7B386|nr:zf-TFIIB domain-containing protein [Nocardioides litoris]